MKIIDIAICIDNIDPKGLGRIRCVRFSDYVSEKEKAGSYEPFSDTDIFVAIPFLPTNINFIPEIGQSVKILNYSTEKENVNQEYVAGPFTTVHNFNDKSFTTQISDTTYGNSIKKSPDIFDSKENYLKPRSEGSIANKKDYGVYGKYGSDLIFTENGLQLRGGKLLSKDRANEKDRKDISQYPIMAKKSSVLNLKKFSNKMEFIEEEEEKIVSEVKNLNYLIEYELVDSSNQITISDPYSVRFYVYKILKAYGDITKTNNFNENSKIPSSLLKLINIENDNTSPTHTVVLPSTGYTNVSGEIRDFIYTIHEKHLKKINSLYEKGDLHPFFFRPKEEFVLISGTTSEVEYKKNILSSVNIHTVGPKSGLVFSVNGVTPPTKSTKVVTQKIKLDKNSDEQSFSSLKSDKIYLLSTDTNKTNKSVPFEKLDKYEPTQSDYIEQIEPNTYSTVRGENLILLLEKIISVLFEHQHNVIGPMVKRDQFQSYTELVKLIETMRNDLLNRSIRIN